MENLTENIQTLELSRQFISEGFKKLKKDNPEFFETLKPVMENRSAPSFLYKYLGRVSRNLEKEKYLESVQGITGLSKIEIKRKLREGMTISELINLKK